MAVPLSKETTARVAALFRRESERQSAIEMLRDRCGGDLPLWTDVSPQGLERIRFAVLKLSEGRMDSLRAAVTMACTDWRDALVAADFAEDPRAHLGWHPV